MFRNHSNHTSSDDEKLIACLLIIATCALFIFIVYFFSMMIRELKKEVLKGRNERRNIFNLDENDISFV